MFIITTITEINIFDLIYAHFIFETITLKR